MTSLINYLRELIGSTDSFWHSFENGNSYNNWNWDYGLLFEYFIAGVLVVVVISNVFKFLRALIS
jgi:hypothetical protein